MLSLETTMGCLWCVWSIIHVLPLLLVLSDCFMASEPATTQCYDLLCLLNLVLSKGSRECSLPSNCHNQALNNDLYGVIYLSLRVWCHYKVVSFPRPLQNTPHSSPDRVRYVVSFLGSNSDLYPTSATAIKYMISCYIMAPNSWTVCHIPGIVQTYNNKLNFLQNFSKN